LLALALGALPAIAAPAHAHAAIADGTDVWFAGTRLTFDKATSRGGELAIANDDSGLERFLAKLGATLAYQPGQKYAIVTAADRTTIVFTLGDAHYTVGGMVANAPFAPYVQDGSAYFPFESLARALAVDPVPMGRETVLEPQISALDVRTENRVTVVTVRGASALHFKRTSDPNADGLTLEFSGIASTLEPDREIGGAGLRAVTIGVRGNAKNPTTTMSFAAAPGGARVLAPSGSPNVLTLAFAPAGVTLGGTPIPSEGTSTLALAPLLLRGGTPVPGSAASTATTAGLAAPPAVPATTATTNTTTTTTITDGSIGSNAPQAPLLVPPQPPGATAPATPMPTAYALPVATIAAVTPQLQDDAMSVHLAISGNVTYEWHRLSDNRWYVDFKPATLAVPTIDQQLENTAAAALRVKPFVGPSDHLQTVRVALSLLSPRGVTLIPTPDGVTIAVDRADDATAESVGLGELADGNLVASIVPLPAPPPSANVGLGVQGGGAAWKFTPPAGPNSRLIVIDPGHGGSDFGAMHNGLTEKVLTLDISRRLRALLIARGWQVKLTRDSDVDVYQPNDSARDELQARDDIANNAGARLLISVHINSFTTSDLNGTTTYYYRADSYALADAVHARLSDALPTKDDGIRKENFYVIHHTTMPAILVETAFLSNPADAALLKQSAFLQKVATAIADGVGDFAGKSTAPVSSNDTTVDGN
jgi:N-acetylmuramoyl-L-alanine amidase